MREEKGQALVEFALILPVLLFIIVGGLELSIHFLMANRAITAANAAALAGSRELPDQDEAEALALEYAEKNGINPEDVEVFTNETEIQVFVELSTLRIFFGRDSVVEMAVYREGGL